MGWCENIQLCWKLYIFDIIASVGFTRANRPCGITKEQMVLLLRVKVDGGAAYCSQFLGIRRNQVNTCRASLPLLVGLGGQFLGFRARSA